MAINGKKNPVILVTELGDLNLLYIGNVSKRILFNVSKFLPIDRKRVNTTEANIHHLKLPFIKKKPKINNAKRLAPNYVGPAVKGNAPQ